LLSEIGCRPRDLVRLHANDLAGTSLRIKGREIPLADPLGQALAAHAAARPGVLLFSARADKPLTIRRIRQITEEHSLRVLGRKTTPRELRYAAIARMLAGGAQQHHIQAAAGLGALRTSQLAKHFAPPATEPQDGGEPHAD
jgi:integrase